MLDGVETKDIAIVVAQNPVLVLTDTQKFDAFYDAIRQEAMSLVPDLTTAKGRKAIASMAYKVAQTKSAIDDAGKRLNEEARARIAKVDASRRDIREKLDALRDEVRKPLTDWEAAEEARIERCRRVIESIKTDGTIRVDDTSDMVADRLACVAGTALVEDEFGEMHGIATDAKAAAISALQRAHDRLLKEEADRAELERLRAEAAARAEAERVAAEEAARQETERREAERAAREAQEAARREEQRRQDAEAADVARIERERREAAAAAAREVERKAREDQEARDRAHREELARVQREREEAEAAAHAEARRQAAELERVQREAREAEEKRQAEIRREQEAREAREAEERRRAADRQHRGEIMRAAKEALMEHAGLDEEAAKRVVLAITGGNVPAISIRF